MSRPRRVSDEEILDAVRGAVREEGPHVSLDLVADRLGVTAPALFRRFRSRNDLLLAALRPEERPPFVAHLDAGPDDRAIDVQLDDLLNRIGTFLATALPCMTALRESGIPLAQLHATFEDPPPLRAARALAGWLERARARGLVAVDDVHMTATAMLGAVQAPIFLRHLANETGPWDAKGFAQQLTDLLLRGVAPESQLAPATGARAHASQLRRRPSSGSKERP